jgi:tryptophan synthase alpha chain
VTELDDYLMKLKNRGHRILVPYLMGGQSGNWLEYVEACFAAGADLIEVGIPFSDPNMDGPVIQRASEQALEHGATWRSVIADVKSTRVPMVAMTYYNIFFYNGLERVAGELASAGFMGVIIPDLPIEESEPWRKIARRNNLATVQLVSPVTSDERARTICELSEGFVYAVGLMGVTGERVVLAETAIGQASRLGAMTQKPILVGIGISNEEQARNVVAAGADGVVVGSALVRRILDGQSPAEIENFVGKLRQALDRS